MNPQLKVIGKRVARLALAAFLLYIDVRLFALYLFLIVLRAWEMADYLGSLQRVSFAIDHARWLSLLRKTDVTREEVQDAVTFMDEYRTVADVDALASDMSIVTGVRVKREDLFGSPWAGRTFLRREQETLESFQNRTLWERRHGDLVYDFLDEEDSAGLD